MKRIRRTINVIEKNCNNKISSFPCIEKIILPTNIEEKDNEENNDIKANSFLNLQLNKYAKAERNIEEINENRNKFFMPSNKNGRKMNDAIEISNAFLFILSIHKVASFNLFSIFLPSILIFSDILYNPIKKECYFNDKNERYAEERKYFSIIKEEIKSRIIVIKDKIIAEKMEEDKMHNLGLKL